MAFPTVYPTVAKIMIDQDAKLEPFQYSRPIGVTVHYSADGDLKRTIASLKAEGLGYHLIIDRDGKVYQTAPLNKRVDHAGVALWRELSPNRWHAAVSLVSWGALTKKGQIYLAWNGSAVQPAEVIQREGNLSAPPGFWHAATPAQEDALLHVLAWFVALGVDPKNICGHDEAAMPVGRKQDPGGVIQYKMAQLRDHFVSAKLTSDDDA